MEKILLEKDFQIKDRTKLMESQGREVSEEYLQSAQYWFDVIYYFLQPHSEALGMIEAIQYPGDIVFIPSTWHHLALSLDFTVGVTQNYISRKRFNSQSFRTCCVDDSRTSWINELGLKGQELFTVEDIRNLLRGFVIGLLVGLVIGWVILYSTFS
jgi:hypothetical protein